MKEIIPNKLIISFNSDGSIQKSILQYKLKIDNKTDNKFYTMKVDDGLISGDVKKITDDSISHAEIGEKIK